MNLNDPNQIWIAICNYTFPIDLLRNGFPFGAKFIRKSVTTIQILFGLTKFRKDCSVCNMAEDMVNFERKKIVLSL